MGDLVDIPGFLLYKENTTKKQVETPDELMMQSEQDAELTRKFD